MPADDDAELGSVLAYDYSSGHIPSWNISKVGPIRLTWIGRTDIASPIAAAIVIAILLYFHGTFLDGLAVIFGHGGPRAIAYGVLILVLPAASFLACHYGGVKARRIPGQIVGITARVLNPVLAGRSGAHHIHNEPRARLRTASTTYWSITPTERS